MKHPLRAVEMAVSHPGCRKNFHISFLLIRKTKLRALKWILAHAAVALPFEYFFPSLSPSLFLSLFFLN